MIFFPKSKFQVRPTLLAALAVFEDGHEPKLFLIPATQWKNPDGIFVDREYKGLKSLPEYGINLSKKGIKALEPFHFTHALESIFGADLPIIEDP